MRKIGITLARMAAMVLILAAIFAAKAFIGRASLSGDAFAYDYSHLNYPQAGLEDIEAAEDEGVEVPAIMYHHFSDEGGGVSSTEFAEHLQALSAAGYTAVSVREMIDYVLHDGTLPEKPVCITMDDGYLSNYEIAYPLLKEYGMKGTVFAIGCSVGHKEFYKDTEFPLTPHFGWDEAREMAGVLDVQSHTWDMHQWAPFEEGEDIRPDMLPLEGEGAEDYAAALQADLEFYDQERIRELGEGFCALAYPSGHFNDLTEQLIHAYGIPLTFSIRWDARNVLVRGEPESLYALCRRDVPEGTSGEELLGFLENLT